jgi:hypothetical protein
MPRRTSASRNRTQSKKQGGGLFGSSKPEFIKYFKKAQKSERDLIIDYRKHAKASVRHAETYEKHLANLKALDSLMPDGFESFGTIFKTRVMSDIKTSIRPDTSSPLFLRNYKLDDIEDKDDLARKHLIQQVEFVRRTKFAPEEAVLIRKINVGALDKENGTFIMIVTGINFAKDSKRQIHHTNFTARFDEIRAALADVISVIKQDVMTQAVKNSLFDKPNLKNDDSNVKVVNLDDNDIKAPKPKPDIYGVKRILNSPLKPSQPAYGDDKPVFGAQKPVFLPKGEPPAMPPAMLPMPPAPMFGQKPFEPAGESKPFEGFGAPRPFETPKREPAFQGFGAPRPFESPRRDDGQRSSPAEQGQDRPPRNFGEGQDRPPRNFGEGQDRPPRNFGEGQDRPPRNFGDGQDRPPRNFGEGRGNRDRERRPPPRNFEGMARNNRRSKRGSFNNRRRSRQRGPPEPPAF